MTECKYNKWAGRQGSLTTALTAALEKIENKNEIK